MLVFSFWRFSLRENALQAHSAYTSMQLVSTFILAKMVRHNFHKGMIHKSHVWWLESFRPSWLLLWIHSLPIRSLKLLPRFLGPIILENYCPITTYLYREGCWKGGQTEVAEVFGEDDYLDPFQFGLTLGFSTKTALVALIDNLWQKWKVHLFLCFLISQWLIIPIAIMCFLTSYRCWKMVILFRMFSSFPWFQLSLGWQEVNSHCLGPSSVECHKIQYPILFCYIYMKPLGEDICCFEYIVYNWVYNWVYSVIYFDPRPAKWSVEVLSQSLQTV